MFLVSIAFAGNELQFSSMTDARDGKTYKTVKIGNQTWMAENLNYKIKGSMCYNNKDGNCKKYGRLYTWEAAKKACPAGWHLPSYEGFDALLKTVKKDDGDVFDNLIASSWADGEDKFGFSALPAGISNKDEGFRGLDDFASFWSSTKGYFFGVGDRRARVSHDRYYYGMESDGYSVRCLRNSNENAKPLFGTLDDSRDGKTYKTVKIGNQNWMAENLNYKTEGSSYYDNKDSNRKKYGRLYTWKAAMQACPTGWHLPSYDEFDALLKTVGNGTGERVNKLKASSWENGEDKFGFSALPAGLNRGSSYFDEVGRSSRFWSSTRAYFNGAYSFLYISDDFASLDSLGSDDNGYSVRCLQDLNDLTALKDGRDGKIYKTVKIGDQTWMAENLNYKTDGSYCYNDDNGNCKEYGRLYTWMAAMQACPSGWHLPSSDEFETLLKIVENDSREGINKLKAIRWEDGEGKYGFSALPAGFLYNEYREYRGGGHYTYFWTSTKVNDDQAYRLLINDNSASRDTLRLTYRSRNNGYSVRCLLDTDEPTPLSQSQSSNILKDSRDGKIYKTVEIGNQTWMAENLNYKMEGGVCNDNEDSNCKQYGRFYSWEAAMQACPSGWHLPSYEEFETLLKTVGNGDKDRTNNLTAYIWGGGIDKYGYSAFPAGYYDKGRFDAGTSAHFWSSTDKFFDIAYSLDIGKTYYKGKKVFGYSVRCLQDTDEFKRRSQARPSGTLKDGRDGNTYKTVKIGNRTWMAENLNYKMESSMCPDGKDSYCKEYGRLYTQEAARKACPSGWRLPSYEEFQALLKIVNKDGSILRSARWWNGSDKYGFSALPAGYYDGSVEIFYSGEHDGYGYGAYFWGSTEFDEDGRRYNSSLVLGINDEYNRNAYVDNGANSRNGYSVRCLQGADEIKYGSLKDSRDGKTYKTVKIENQVWMAENLNYKTGSSVCYENKDSNCQKYGRLYTWEAAKKACPTGWHLPSKKELALLSYQSKGLLRAASWEKGNDKFGFSALPAGVKGGDVDYFFSLGEETEFWSSTESSGGNAYRLFIRSTHDGVESADKNGGRSVRCLQD